MTNLYNNLFSSTQITESLASEYKDTDDVKSLLKSVLALTLILSDRAKEAHWNIKGANFNATHEFFGEFYDFLIEAADTVAERLVQLEEPATTVHKSGSPLISGDSHKLFSYLTQYTQFLAKKIKNAIEISSKSDQVTADVFIEYGREVEKWLWKIESHIKNTKE